MSQGDRISGTLDRLVDIPDPWRDAVDDGAAGADPTPPATPSPTRPERARLRRAAVVLAALWIGGIVWALGGVDAGLYASAARLALVLGWSSAGALAWMAVTHPGRRGLGPRAWAAQAVAFGVPAAALVAALAWGVPGGSSSLPAMLGCFGATLALAAGPLLVATRYFRRSFATLAAWRGAAVGGLSGLAGGVAITLHCPVAHDLHLAASHALPVAAGALLGALLGRFAWRA